MIPIVRTAKKLQDFFEKLDWQFCFIDGLAVQDWNDIKTVIIKQENLDWRYVNEQLAPLVELKYAPEILTKLDKLRQSS